MSSFVCAGWVVVAAALVGCGSITGQSDASGTAGVTGSAGRGGTTGASGTGAGGMSGAGTAGTVGVGGRGGTSATAGTSGGAGRGGGAGTAATGGGGRGGAGGTNTTGSAGRGGAGGMGGGVVVCNLACMMGRTCCGAACVNTNNDPMNCGACGRRCEGNAPLCSSSKCVIPPCSPTILCQTGATCCGQACCAAGELCCEADGPVSGGAPSCFLPTRDQPTCPQGCAPLCVSDRNQKKNIEPADTSAILDQVSRLPISLWSYRDEPDAVRHLGPMAQDFRARFGLGNDDRTFFSVDAHGVALAAIQALDRRLTEQQQRIEKLERENRELARRLRDRR